MGTMVQSPVSQAGSRPASPGVMAATRGSPGEDRAVSYDKIISLFTHRHSSELYDRHVAAIHRMCRAAANGFAIRELPKVQQILEFTLDLLQKAPTTDTVEAAVHLIRTLSMPFVRRTSTDEFKMLNNISSILTTVGKAVSSSFPSQVQITAAEMLAEFASAYGNRPSTLELETDTSEADMGSSKRQFHTNQGLLQKSGVVPRVVAALLEASDEFSVKHLVHASVRNAVMLAGGPGCPPNTGVEYVYKDVCMAMTRALVEFSYVADNAFAAVSAGVVASMPALLAFDINDPLVFSALELLWNCLEAGTAGMRCGPVNQGIIEGLAYALDSLLMQYLDHGFREADKQTRNEVLLLVILLLNEPYFRTAMCNTSTPASLALVCSVPEATPSHPFVKTFLLSADQEDFEMRQLGWTCLAGLCEDVATRKEVLEIGMLDALVLYADGEALGKGGGIMTSALSRWTPSQLLALQESALDCLQRLVALDPGAFLAAGANHAVLQFANHCKFEMQNVLLERTLKIMRIASTDMALRNAFGEAGAIPLVISLLCDSEHALPESIPQMAAMILGDLCVDHESNQVSFRRVDGVMHLQQKLVQLRASDSTLPNKLVLVVLRAVWNCIIQNRKNMVRFLVSDGLDALLDILEAGHCSLHPLCLSMIADILENPKAHVFFHEWISTKSGRRATELLIHVWRQEDKKRGIMMQGRLTNTTRPLIGTGTRTEWLPTSEVTYGFQSPQKRNETQALTLAVPGEQVLAKIYSCFKLLGFESVAEPVGEEQRAVLASIEAYVKFKQGEFWQDLQHDLTSTGIVPTEEDDMRIASGVESAQYLAQTIRTNQDEILSEKMEKELAAEQAFYESKRLQEAQEKGAKLFKKDNTKLSMVERKEAKATKEAMLKNSYVKDWE